MSQLSTQIISQVLWIRPADQSAFDQLLFMCFSSLMTQSCHKSFGDNHKVVTMWVVVLSLLIFQHIVDRQSVF